MFILSQVSALPTNNTDILGYNGDLKGGPTVSAFVPFFFFDFFATIAWTCCIVLRFLIDAIPGRVRCNRPWFSV